MNSRCAHDDNGRNDRQCMTEALELAARGLWTTHPNPRVGCLIVRGGEVVGRGWHERAGGPHAEVGALEQAGARARGATAYVTLEPCSHHGRTPPCADALIEAGIERVVCATEDPHPKVAGDGIRRLVAAGIEVDCGLLEQTARELNAGFFSRIERGRPWLRVKLAGSLDGRSSGPDGASKWITGEAARSDGHHWRARADAILTGIETVLADDPALNVRLENFSRAPTVIVADSRNRLPSGARLLSTGAAVWQAGGDRHGAPPAGVERLDIGFGADGRVDLDALLAELAKREIGELHVEAGPTLTGALLARGLADELLVYLAPCLIGASGAPLAELPGVEKLSQRLHFKLLESTPIGADLRLRLRPVSNPENLKPET